MQGMTQPILGFTPLGSGLRHLQDYFGSAVASLRSPSLSNVAQLRSNLLKRLAQLALLPTADPDKQQPLRSLNRSTKTRRPICFHYPLHCSSL